MKAPAGFEQICLHRTEQNRADSLLSGRGAQIRLVHEIHADTNTRPIDYSTLIKIRADMEIINDEQQDLTQLFSCPGSPIPTPW